MKILVFSDTHGRIDSCIRIIKNTDDVDMIIHAGDHSSDAEEIQKQFPDIPVKYVRGNCDFSSAPSELIINTEYKDIFVTHGHLYNVKLESDYRTLIERAKSKNAGIIVFGHTHIPFNENNVDYSILNPGSVKYSGTYGIISIKKDKIQILIQNNNKLM